MAYPPDALGPLIYHLTILQIYSMSQKMFQLPLNPKFQKGVAQQVTVGATSETHSWVSTMFEGEKHTNIY